MTEVHSTGAPARSNSPPKPAGEAVAQLVERYGAGNRFVGVEVSEPMLSGVRRRFSISIGAGVAQVRRMDLRHEYPPELW